MEDVKFIQESKNYVSEIASSWFASTGFVGVDKNISMTFVRFVSKPHRDEMGNMNGQSSLITEAIASITLDEKNARMLAEAILNQLDNSAPQE